MILSEKERSAIDVVRSSDPLQQGSGNHGLLVILEEFRHAADLAAKADLPLDVAFVHMVDGFQTANNVDHQAAVTSITAFLRGVLILFDEPDPGRAYSAALLKWYEHESVLTHHGLVGVAPPTSEGRFLEVLSVMSATAAANPENTLALGYENCAAASHQDADWWASQLTALVEESPPSSKADDAFGLLAMAELAVPTLCPRYLQIWASTKSVLADQPWYPDRAAFPYVPDELAGLFE